MKNFRKIIHSLFRVKIPKDNAEFALELTNAFIDWLTTQTDVYLRSKPRVIDADTDRVELIFRAGLDRNPDQTFPGTVITSETAYEELCILDGKF